MRHIGIIFFSIVLLLQGCTRQQRVARAIAYIGRYTNAADSIPIAKQTKNSFDVMHEVILRQYVEELNAEFPQLALELRTFDCQRTARGADSVYSLISADTTILAVIDNTWGVHIAGAQPRILRETLPVIAINADQNGLDFGAASIFTGNSDGVPDDLATYIDKALNEHGVNFITESDYTLTQGYYRAFTEKGIAIHKEFRVHSSKVLNPDSLQYVVEDIQKYYGEHPEEMQRLLVINVHSNWGNALLPAIDARLDGLHMLGHAYIANGKAIDGFGKDTKNELILITNPTDAMSRKVHVDLDLNRKKHPEEFNNLNAPLFTKRCLDAIAIVRAAIKPVVTKSPSSSKSTASDSLPTRTTVRNRLQALRNTTFAGETDLYTLDAHGILVPDLTFSKYYQGKLFSMPRQLNSRREIIPNLLFGMEIQDIYDLNISSNSFTADFYYWVKMDSSNREAEKYISFQNMKSSQSNKELIIEHNDGGQIYKLYRVSGSFYVNYHLEDFPFDKQELAVNVEILDADDRLKISFDQSALMLDSATMEKFKVTGWNKKAYFLTVDNIISRSNKGDPLTKSQTLRRFKGFVFHLGVERIVLGSFLQIILPLVLIGLIAIAVLFIRNLSFENVGEVSVGIFLSIVAFSISLSSMIPSSSYLTRADILFWITFLVVFCSFMTIIVLNSLYDEEHVRVYRLKKLGTTLAVLYPALVAWVLFW